MITYTASCCSRWSSSSLSICDCFLYLSLFARSSLNSTFIHIRQHFNSWYICYITTHTVTLNFISRSVNYDQVNTVSWTQIVPVLFSLIELFTMLLRQCGTLLLYITDNLNSLALMEGVFLHLKPKTYYYSLYFWPRDCTSMPVIRHLWLTHGTLNSM